jgi:hypothetical protein
VGGGWCGKGYRYRRRGFSCVKTRTCGQSCAVSCVRSLVVLGQHQTPMFGHHLPGLAAAICSYHRLQHTQTFAMPVREQSVTCGISELRL